MSVTCFQALVGVTTNTEPNGLPFLYPYILLSYCNFGTGGKEYQLSLKPRAEFNP